MAGPAAQITTWQCQAEDGSLSSVTVHSLPCGPCQHSTARVPIPHAEAHPGGQPRVIKRSLGAADPNLSTKDRGGGLARDTGLGAFPRHIRQNLRTI